MQKLKFFVPFVLLFALLLTIGQTPTFAQWLPPENSSQPDITDLSAVSDEQALDASKPSLSGECEMKMKKLHRYWNPNIGDHFYTSNYNELRGGKHGYQYQEVVGYVSKKSGRCGSMPLVPLYRYWNSGNGDHFYTTNWNELRNGGGGYVYEGSVGYVPLTNKSSDCEDSGLDPLFRYWNPNISDHFYTNRWSELENGKDGYIYEGVIGCLKVSHIKGYARTNQSTYTVSLWKRESWGWDYKYDRFFRNTRNGEYDFYNLPKGKYRLKITTRSGWRECSDEIKIDGLNTKWVDCKD